MPENDVLIFFQVKKKELPQQSGEPLRQTKRKKVVQKQRSRNVFETATIKTKSGWAGEAFDVLLAEGTETDWFKPFECALAKY